MNDEPQPVPEIATSFYDEDECIAAFCRAKPYFGEPRGPGGLCHPGHPFHRNYMGFHLCWLQHHPVKLEMSACENAYREYRRKEHGYPPSAPLDGGWLTWEAAWIARDQQVQDG